AQATVECIHCCAGQKVIFNPVSVQIDSTNIRAERRRARICKVDRSHNLSGQPENSGDIQRVGDVHWEWTRVFQPIVEIESRTAAGLTVSDVVRIRSSVT